MFDRMQQRRRALWHRLLAFGAIAVDASVVLAQPVAAPSPPFRQRLLGVYSHDTGAPLETALVTDVLTGRSALTTSTGIVALSFLPEGASIVRVQKLGYRPATLAVEITPRDTLPLTIVLESVAQTLATVTTVDTAPLRSARLRGFDERRREGFGRFITEKELRKNDNRSMTMVIRRLPSIRIRCPLAGPRLGQCYGVATRSISRYVFLGGECTVDLYVDGIVSSDNDLEHLSVNEFAGVEYYPGGATMPAQYNRSGSSCGALLLWTRDRL